MYAWVLFVFDKGNNNVRGSVRSRGPIINEVAAKYNGGGHIYASGARISGFEDADNMIQDLDEVCKEYKINNNL
jgi:phosphoesterase RecJ-like protein